MGTTVSLLDGSSNDTSENEKPKTRLDLLLSNHEEWAVAFPSLSLSSPKNTAAPSDSCSAAHLAETCLGRPVQYALAEISSAPENMARSVAGTFKSLIYANLRSFARMRDCQNSWDASTSSCFRSRISDSALVRVFRVSSKFTFLSAGKEPDNTKDTRTCQLRLLANFSFDIDVDGTKECIDVDAAGHITGFNAPESCTLNSINVQLDCPALLTSLRQQARLVAYGFVTRNVSQSVLKQNEKGFVRALQKAQVVTPRSSPLLSILSAAAATLMEPMTLDVSSQKRQASVAECGTLPPKKRLRRAVTPPVVDSAQQAMIGVAALTGVGE